MVSSPSLLLRSTMAEARTVVDAAGNAKLNKGTEGGRWMRACDDAPCAVLLGVAESVRRYQRRPCCHRPLRTALVG